MKIQAYLAFDGNCQQALNYYAEIFDAEVKNRQTYEDKKMDVPASYRQKLQHAELIGNNIRIMAYDAAPDTPITHGTQIHMAVDVNDQKKAEQLFSELSGGGQVHHEFREREWGYYGRCTDQYGINWMVNSET